MKEIMVHTPEAHIPICRIFVEGHVIYLQFKKSKSDISEIITLDQLIFLIVSALFGRGQENY